MANREKIQDWTGKIWGFKEQIGSKLWLYDFYGRKLGYYDSATKKPMNGPAGRWVRAIS